MGFRFLDFEFDEERLELRHAGEVVALQPKPLAVLLHLLRSSPGISSRAELLAAVWPGEVVTDNSISRAVRQLRHALETKRQQSPVVQTVRARGYRLAVPVEITCPGSTIPSAAAEPSGAFVGRERELATLAQALEEASRGAGHVLVIVGEAGVGKTRTLQHFAHLAEARGARVLWGSCYEGTWSPPYGPFVEALEAHVAATPPELLRTDFYRLGSALAEAVPSLWAALPALPEAMPLPPDARRHRMLEAFAEVLLAIARRAPLLLVVEDLHWAGAETLQLLRRLGRASRRGPILLVGTYREEELGGESPLVDALAVLEQEAPRERLALQGLEPEDVAVLLRNLIGRDPAPALAGAVYAETEGNPFLVRELAIHLRERGEVESLQDTRSVSTLLETIGAPEGVRHLVQRRLSRLSKDARLLIEAGAAFEGAFPFEVIRRVCGLGDEPALEALDEVLDAQILQPTGSDAYAFTHALVRRAVRTDANPSRRVRLHRRIAETLETWSAHDLRRHVVEIAHQYYRSRSLPGAAAGVGHCQAAADQAERVAAFDAMTEYLGMALEILPDDDPRRGRLLARLALAHAWDCKADAAVETAKRAADALADVEGPAAAAESLARTAQAIWWSGFGPAGWRLAPLGLLHVGERRDLTWARLMLFELLQREAADPVFPGIPQDSAERREVSRVILDHWSELDAREKNALFAAALAFASREEVLERAADVPLLIGFWAGDYRRAATLALEIGEQSLERGHPAAALFFFTALARCQLALGQLASADASYARSLGIAGGLEPTPEIVTLLHAFRVDRALVLDEGAEEEARFMEGFFATATRETRWIVANGMAFTAALHARTGAREAALRLLPEVLEIVERAPGWALGYTWSIHCAAEALWLLERTDEVAVVERNLRQKTLAPDFRHPHTDARLSLARLCALTGRFDEASAQLDDARRVLDAQGARPLRAIADFDGALLCARRRASGDRERARDQIEAARKEFSRLGMTGWVRRADRLTRTL